MQGQGPFEEALPVAAMAYLYLAVLQIATTSDTGITTMEELSGKRINLGPPGSNSAVLVQRLMETYGVFDPANAQFLSYTEGTAALMNGQVDATVVLAGAPTAALIDLGAQRDMVLLSIDAETVAPMLAEYPFYQTYEMPAGTYDGQDEPVMVINDPATIFTSQFATDDQVYAITKALFDNLDELAQVHPEAAKIQVETAVNTPIGLHQGAQLYFDEQAQ